jgi:Sigma-70 region 3
MDDGGEVRIPGCYVTELADFFAAHDQWLFGHACVRTRGDREPTEPVRSLEELRAAGIDELTRTARRMFQELGREPTPEELAAELEPSPPYARPERP